MSNQFIKKTLLSAAVAAATLSAGQLSAAQIEEVIVTTQKREQSLQDVPVSVSAFTGNFMDKAQINDAKELSLLTPGVSGDTDDSFLDSINVRGISTNDFGVGAEPSIGVYQNGVYLGRTGGALSSFFDIEMVELGDHGLLIFQVSLILINERISLVNDISNIVEHGAIGAHVHLLKFVC